jgi:phosphoserine phosphatase RsbU/P
VLLTYLNDRLARAYTRGGTFITAFYAVLDPVARTLTYSTAGHNPPRLMRGGSVIALNADGGLPLGIFPSQAYEQTTVQLEPGDLLLLYTDGITEAMAPLDGAKSRELFGSDRLDKVLVDCVDRDAQECIDMIRSALAAFTQNVPLGDDQTLIAIRCL